MAEIKLPANSRIGKGKNHKVAGASRVRTIVVYRYDPDNNENPRMD